MKGYFDKHIRNRFFLGCKAKKQSGLFGRNEAGNFSTPPRPTSEHAPSAAR